MRNAGGMHITGIDMSHLHPKELDKRIGRLEEKVGRLEKMVDALTYHKGDMK